MPHFKKNMKKILVDINNSKISLITGGKGCLSGINGITENVDSVFRIQFSSIPDLTLLKEVTEIIKINPQISLRFYGNFSEDLIKWEELKSVQRLFIDLWETKNLEGLRNLTQLKRLGISKNVKTTVNLNVIENLNELEMFFTSISKGIESASKLKNLQFISLNEIKSDSLDFLSENTNLSTVWISFGSIKDISSINEIQNLKTLSVHQLRGFNHLIANSILSKCLQLEKLELMNLKDICQLNFLEQAKNLTTLNLEGLKNIESYHVIRNNIKLKTISGYDCRPQDKSLFGLENIESVTLGDSYSKSEIDAFTKRFNGENLWIRGKQIIGQKSVGGRIAILND